MASILLLGDPKISIRDRFRPTPILHLVAQCLPPFPETSRLRAEI